MAVLYNKKNRNDIAKIFLDKCLKIKNYPSALHAAKKLGASPKFDWYSWWFDRRMSKKALGVILITTIFSLILYVSAVIIYLSLLSHSISTLCDE
jgi:hypothetical protein